jgi:hypothetical protein
MKYIQGIRTRFRRKYPSFPWYEEYLGAHISCGPATLYGFNAMHVALDIRTPWGYLCLHPTIKHHGSWWPWKVYLSPDATPGSRVWGIGPGLRTPKRRKRLP